MRSGAKILKNVSLDKGRLSEKDRLKIALFCPHCGENTILPCGMCNNDLFEIIIGDYKDTDRDRDRDREGFKPYQWIFVPYLRWLPVAADILHAIGGSREVLNYKLVCTKCENIIAIVYPPQNIFKKINYCPKCHKEIDFEKEYYFQYLPPSFSHEDLQNIIPPQVRAQREKLGSATKKETKREKEGFDKEKYLEITQETDTFFDEKIMGTSFLLIDSNIWMNTEYDSFFKLLREKLKKNANILSLFGAQFDEMCNVKKGSDFGTNDNIAARCAINRIEKFQKENLLQIESVTLNSRRGAYADPLIIDILIKLLKEGKNATFISDDIELRIRVREKAKEYEGKIAIFEGKPLLKLCSDYFNAKNVLDAAEAAGNDLAQEAMHPQPAASEVWAKKYAFVITEAVSKRINGYNDYLKLWGSDFEKITHFFNLKTIVEYLERGREKARKEVLDALLNVDDAESRQCILDSITQKEEMAMKLFIEAYVNVEGLGDALIGKEPWPYSVVEGAAAGALQNAAGIAVASWRARKREQAFEITVGDFHAAVADMVKKYNAMFDELVKIGQDFYESVFKKNIDSSRLLIAIEDVDSENPD